LTKKFRYMWEEPLYELINLFCIFMLKCPRCRNWGVNHTGNWCILDWNKRLRRSNLDWNSWYSLFPCFRSLRCSIESKGNVSSSKTTELLLLLQKMISGQYEGKKEGLSPVESYLHAYQADQHKPKLSENNLMSSR